MPDLLSLLADLDAPLWPGGCQHKRTFEGDNEHAITCLDLTCPHCGIRCRNAYDLLMNHEPYGRHFEQFGTCSPQRWSFARVASCMVCHWPTFGVWPCRNDDCASGCHSSHPFAPCPTERARRSAETEFTQEESES